MRAGGPEGRQGEELCKVLAGEWKRPERHLQRGRGAASDSE